MKAQLIREGKIVVGHDRRGRPMTRNVPAGHIIDRPDAYKLVHLGTARPADDECSRAANMTEEQMQRAIQASLRASKGILPEDWAAFDRGEMDGYDPRGNPIPGPNAHAAAPEADDTEPYEPPE